MVSMAIAFSTSKLLVLLFLMALNYFDAITIPIFGQPVSCFCRLGIFQVDFGVEIIDASFNMQKKSWGKIFVRKEWLGRPCCFTDRIRVVKGDF